MNKNMEFIFQLNCQIFKTNIRLNNNLIDGYYFNYLIILIK